MMESDPRTFAVIGAAMEVHGKLGCGFLEAVYQEAMERELELRDIPFARQVDLLIRYKGRVLETRYRADLVCYGSALVELKALTQTGTAEEAQVLNYLKATGYQTGLLLNFGRPSLQYKRYILDRTDDPPADF